MSEKKEPCPKCGSRKLVLETVRDDIRLIFKTKCSNCDYISIPLYVYGFDTCYCGKKIKPRKKKCQVFKVVCEDEIVRYQFCSKKCANAFVEKFYSKHYNKELGTIIGTLLERTTKLQKPKVRSKQ